MAISETSRVRV